MDRRNTWQAVPAWIVAAALTAAISCGVCGCRKSREGAVSTIGSTSIQPFAEMLAQEFNARQSEVRVEVQGGGSTVGLRAIAEGIADIGMSSRDLKPNEKFTKIVIARDGIAVVVHPSNPVRTLSRAELRATFAGERTNWNQVPGGDDRPIRLITREEGSGTREAFSGMVMATVDPKTGHKGEPLRISEHALTQESNGAVRELLRGDRCAIGYMSLGLVGTELKKVDVDGVAPTHESTENGTYALSRPFLFVFRGQPSVNAMKFVDFMLSDHAQGILQKAGLIRAPRQPLSATRPAGTPASAPATKPAPGAGASAGGTWSPLTVGVAAVLALGAFVLVFRRLTPVYKEKAIGTILMLAALSAISGLALITIFIFREGLPLMAR
ncbi:MAG: phosphate ABC transporter substrate-binding protein, partial [Planctomycetota bacterium]|nr:phosphate ABC transporter substrate-binding protein [Planctomycetota bacterium]